MSFTLKAARLAIAASLTASAVASASVDTSPGPGGIVPLKPGVYVAKGSTCRNPPNAAIRDYDRRSFTTASTHACHATVVSKRGTSYQIEQSCVGAGMGPAPRVVERFAILVDNAITFRLQRGSNTAQYRYCPIYQLPKGLLPRVR